MSKLSSPFLACEQEQILLPVTKCSSARPSVKEKLWSELLGCLVGIVFFFLFLVYSILTQSLEEGLFTNRKLGGKF